MPLDNEKRDESLNWLASFEPLDTATNIIVGSFLGAISILTTVTTNSAVFLNAKISGEHPKFQPLLLTKWDRPPSPPSELPPIPAEIMGNKLVERLERARELEQHQPRVR